MTNLHYAYIKEIWPDLRTPPEELHSRAFAQLWPFVRYVKEARYWLQSQTLEIEWENADPPQQWQTVLSENLSRLTPNTEGRERENPIWVRLKEPENDEGEDTLYQFLDARYIQTGLRKGRRLKVLARNVDEAILELSARPETNKLYLKPDDTVLQRQESALERLINVPAPAYRGILKLVESEWAFPWKDVVPIHVDEESWILLTDTGRSGTVEQRHFVEIALGTEDFAILNGPPGSGKTITICEYILQEIRKGHKVLLCASTHVAVDNVIEKLEEGGQTRSLVIPVRIGEEARVSDIAKPFLLKNWVERERESLMSFLNGIKHRTESQEFLLKSLEEDPKHVIENLVLESANLVCGTTMGILSHPDLRAWDSPSRHGQSLNTPPYDVLIVDECSKTTFSEFLVPALLAKKWIIAGDSKQLSPYVDQGYLHANLDGIVPKEDSAICAPFLDAPPKSSGIIVSFPTPEERQKAKLHADGLGLTSIVIEDGPRESGPFTTMAMWGSDVAIIAPELVKEWEPFLPPGVINHTRQILPLHGRRTEAWKEFRRRQNRRPLKSESSPRIQIDEPEAEEWSYEIGWRLTRAFELRHSSQDAKTYLDQVERLIPRWYPLSEDMSNESKPKISRNDIIRNLELVYQVAFPSILDIIEEGIPPSPGMQKEEVPVKSNSALRAGLGDALKSRQVTLTYQHRMHPDISRIPRKHVYHGSALKDARNMEVERRWPRPYPRYHSRLLWLDVKGRIPDPRKNENPNEVKELIRELEAFRAWCKTQPIPPDNADKRWKVAVLTFYSAQERCLRRELQKMFHQRTRLYHFDDDSANIDVRLGVVDRFQGQEADVVFLSMVRAPPLSVGFLDNTNRVNVALTRARYQLVIVGNKDFFSRDHRTSRATLCRAVAREIKGGFALGGDS
ncbi:MAG: AAA family ATPase [Nitrososphaerota archaeon]|nr:AAA family ATPase [Nitrososphaerota archaeon]